jgi:hypothetical protein
MHTLAELKVVRSILVETFHRGRHILADAKLSKVSYGKRSELGTSIPTSLESLVKLRHGTFQALDTGRLLQRLLRKHDEELFVDLDRFLQRL